MKTINSLKSQSFIYDFNVDGGALFVRNPMGVFIPRHISVGIVITPIRDLVSSGANGSVIQIGATTSPLSDFMFNNIQGVNGDYRDYNVGTFGFFTKLQSGNPAAGMIGALTSKFRLPAYEVAVTCAGTDPLTDGAFQATIFYLEA